MPTCVRHVMARPVFGQCQLAQEFAKWHKDVMIGITCHIMCQGKYGTPCCHGMTFITTQSKMKWIESTKANTTEIPEILN